MWPFTPKADAQPKPLNVGEVRLERLKGRAYNLFVWFEQKGGRDPAKDAEMREALTRYRHAIAARGLPMPETKEDVMDA